MSNQTTLNSIFDNIEEKVSNIDRHTSNKVIKDTIISTISTLAVRERSLRESTLTVKTNTKYSADKITEILIKDWMSSYSPNFWYDKTSVFVQLFNETIKYEFIENLIATKNESGKIAELLVPINHLGQHFTRKPMRLEIVNIKSAIKANDIIQQLKTYNYPHAIFIEPKDGKLTSEKNSHNLI